MRNTEKNLKVSCTECIHRRRILTCHENGRDCTLCKNACCCRKCSPDASGQELEYIQRKYFSPGISMSEYIQLKKNAYSKKYVELENESSEHGKIEHEKLEHTNVVDEQIIAEAPKRNTKKRNVKKGLVQREEQDIVGNLTTDKNGQLSFSWD